MPMTEIFDEEHTEILARVAWARKRPSLWWLVGAALSFTAAVAITVFAQASHLIERATTLALQDEAAEIGRAVDDAAQAAHQRAEGIANTALMRAAILTDAATVADMMQSELKLALAPGEVVEVFQIHDAKLEMLIRLPATAALPSIHDRDATIVNLDDSGPRVVVGAHVERLKDGAGYDANKAGMFVLSAPVDLAAIRRRLSQHAVDATLAESGKSVELVHSSPVTSGELVRLAVPSRTADLTLTVAPKLDGHHARWIAPVRRATFGLGALMLIAFALIFVVRRPRPRRY
jgi:hypothetical protein